MPPSCGRRGSPGGQSLGPAARACRSAARRSCAMTDWPARAEMAQRRPCSASAALGADAPGAGCSRRCGCRPSS
eukprot:13609426-Heterocapsa_arctica.AAC.1